MIMVKFWLMCQRSYHLTKFLTNWIWAISHWNCYSSKQLVCSKRSCVFYIFRRNESFFCYTPGYGFTPSSINERLLVQWSNPPSTLHCQYHATEKIWRVAGICPFQWQWKDDKQRWWEPWPSIQSEAGDGPFEQIFLEELFSNEKTSNWWTYDQIPRP